ADLSSAAGLLALWLWFRKLTSTRIFDRKAYTSLLWPWSLLAFFWLNAALARTVHHYADVEYRLESLLESSTFQTSLSIFWTVLALSIMQAAFRRSSRMTWIAGAVLLGAVVIKLFAVDLSALETTARIISFLVVGILLLVIGYLTPLPPSDTNADSKSGGK
ncbi:MAG TPA: DUF2339 domain-containing protein, partial [Acidobacteriota bacterium]|nr:DUF2339 domain-containing protein [Acidobacteriota bacterium]